MTVTRGTAAVRDAAGNVAEVDPVAGGLAGIDTLHKEIHEGEGFSAGRLFESVDDDGNADILIVTGAVPLHVVLRGAVGGNSYGYVYGTPAVSANGTQIPIINKHRGSTNVSTATAYHTPTVDSVGTTLQAVFIPGGTKNQAIGASESERDEWIFAPNTRYIIRITNKSGGAVPISIGATWYE